MTKEKEHLCDVFVANGYQEETTRKAFNKRKSKTSEKTEEKHDTLCLPYIRGLSESVEWAVRGLKVRAVLELVLRNYERLNSERHLLEIVSSKLQPCSSTPWLVCV